MEFFLRSSDNKRLHEAKRLAHEYAEQQNQEDVVGITFLGAITRGYFDADSDIDITIFKMNHEKRITSDTREYKGFLLHEFVVDYDNEYQSNWDSGKRWAYSNCQIYREKDKRITSLLKEKVPLKEDEKRWLIMSGIALSEWYCNRLTELWVKRDDIVSSHYMMSEGMNQFFNVLFALNDEITPDFKWKLYCSKQLKILPEKYEEKIADIMKIQDLSHDDLERRKTAFLDIWSHILPRVEEFLGMKYPDFKDRV